MWETGMATQYCPSRAKMGWRRWRSWRYAGGPSKCMHGIACEVRAWGMFICIGNEISVSFVRIAMVLSIVHLLVLLCFDCSNAFCLLPSLHWKQHQCPKCKRPRSFRFIPLFNMIVADMQYKGNTPLHFCYAYGYGQCDISSLRWLEIIYFVFAVAWFSSCWFNCVFLLG